VHAFVDQLSLGHYATPAATSTVENSAAYLAAAA
jgi:hypothetical protein